MTNYPRFFACFSFWPAARRRTTTREKPAGRPLEGVTSARGGRRSGAGGRGRAGEGGVERPDRLGASSRRDNRKGLAAGRTIAGRRRALPLAPVGRVGRAQAACPRAAEDSARSQWAGVFSLLKLREAAWGNQLMAVPFGSPVFCCYYRADLLEKLGRRPPKTWDEYQELAKLLAKNSPRPTAADGQANKNSPLPLGEGQGVRAWCGTIEPLAPGWAGLVLLARAAAYAKHRDNFSTLFDIETMEPLVAGPPFVQALEELVAAAKLGPADPLRYDPAAARAAFWNGQCGMALTWPTAAKQGRGERGEGRGTAASVDLSDPRSSLSPLPSPLSPSPRRLRRTSRLAPRIQPQRTSIGSSGPTTRIVACRCWRFPAAWA